jgi:serine/threonine protein kinase/Tol biopolymer transport system component
MGEVYRAKDPRLGRDVAIKILPASFSSDADRLRRFEQEARAAGVLNHPNITIVYDIGTNSSDGAPYVVQELLEGETLRAELAGGRFSPRKAIDYALQIAHGLAAAHEKGIVHRDLKPENLFVTKEGRVKILDFGLAKLTQVERSDTATNLPTVTPGTEPGVVMGTLGYMSPEQVKARPADARSDIFSFGAIFYEMLSGKRAFHADSAGETMAAILREEPPDLSVTNQNVAPGLERILRHCLEKNPERRFQSSSDIAFALEAVSGLPIASGMSPAAATGRPRRTRSGTAAAAGVALLAGGLLAGAWFASGSDLSHPTFKRLTYRRGFISNARFAPDGQTILYSADWDGAPSRIFSTRPEGRESTALPLPSASLLAVSSQGEMAILLDPKIDYNLYFRRGTLAVVPLSGGSPREVLREVRLADWGPDGKDLAVVRQAGAQQRLEYPPGRLLRESPAWIVSPRVSPRGDRIVFYEGLPFNGYSLSVVDLKGRKDVLGPLRPDFWASAWAPDGREIWFPAVITGAGAETPIMATDLSGRQRLLENGPSITDLNDVSRDGRALITLFDWQEFTRGFLSGQKSESRLVSRTDLRLVDLSEDGKLLVLRDALIQGKPSVWIAGADDSPPVRLGEGVAHGLSPDGAWVLASEQGKLLALPTAAGAPKPVSEGFFEAIRWASWFHDGRRVLVWGQAKAGKTGIFVVDLAGHEPRRIAPEGYELVAGGNALSPDGLLVAARSPENQIVLCPVDGGPPRPIPGLAGLFVPVQWSADGKGFYVFRMGELPTRVERVDVESGRATLWKELAPPDTAGVSVRALAMTPDAAHYAYSCQQYLNTLYLVEGVDSWRKPTIWSRLFGHSR